MRSGLLLTGTRRYRTQPRAIQCDQGEREGEVCESGAPPLLGYKGGMPRVFMISFFIG